MNEHSQSRRDDDFDLVMSLGTDEPDFELENRLFEHAASKMSLLLDKLPGGFYVSQATQHAWALWVHRAAISSAVISAARCTAK